MNKKLILGITAAAITTVTLGVSSVYANGDEHRGVDRHIRHLAKALDLTEEQVSTLKAQSEAKHEQFADKREARSNMHRSLLQLNPESENYQAELNALITEAQAQAKENILTKAKGKEQLYSILTPEQKEKLPALQEKWLERMEKHKGKHDKKGHKGGHCDA